MAISWTLILLIAIATRSDFDWMMTATAGTFTAILTLGEINKRSKLIQVGALAGLAFLAAVGGLYLWRLAYTDLTGTQVLKSCLLYFGSGLAAGFLVLGLLPFIERLFGIATNISLLELCDVNQPALRRLAMEAPGTYTHSLYIGSLAQAAAEAVGAKPLLARVGAYFHDIGKVNKPHYFVENALGKTEAHEGLTPAMSRLVIMSHVKDGLEMADRLGLPRYIKRFIAEHHGTTVVEFFYHEAEVQAERTGNEPPHDIDYRYPGPKPRSRETAIVMLADTVEGATRAMKEPTAARVQAIVHEMVMKRLMDGQLDESGLTLSDLHKIEETLTKALLSVYHTRVPYPTDRPVPEAPAEAGTKKEEPGGLKGAWRA
jgi:putative nucleotidyltransferase with HDIG domain